MKLNKQFFKYMFILFCLLCLVATVQIGTAIYFSENEVKLEPAALVVVFPGEKQRIKPGLVMIKKGSHKHFMVIGETQESLIQLLKRNSVPETVTALPGGKSRSTFEDVYQTAKTIKENQLSSIIVVSSGYHLPRALFLLKAYMTTSGHDIHIQGFPAKEPQQYANKLKQYNNEVIKFWGSIVEMAAHFFTGTLVLNYAPVRKMQLLLKETFLL
ncbi:MAG: hypothetical protein ACI8PB_000253 [Desulforhopalus sp.]